MRLSQWISKALQHVFNQGLHRRVCLWMVALLPFTLPVSLSAHGPEGHSGPARPSQPTAKPQAPAPVPQDLQLDRKPLTPLHGGQVSATKWHYFEVVYLPRQTRIYVYSPSQRLLTPQQARGEVTMRINGNPQPFRFPVQYAMDEQGQGCLAVGVDVTRVRDGDMQVTFDLERLPFTQEPKATFTQTFALTRPTEVVVTEATTADAAAVRAQGTCAVMGTPLGQHGAPIKLTYGGRSIFVCCQGCIDKVKRDPIRFFGPPRQAAAPANRAPQIQVVKVTAADAPAIRAQATCPVMGTPLGQHGEPVKLLIDGRPLFVCCQGCVPRVQSDPQRYLALATRSYR